MSITVECPHCGRHHKLVADAGGTLRRCDCGKSYRVPLPPSDPDAPAVPKPATPWAMDPRRIIAGVALGLLILWLGSGLRVRDVAPIVSVDNSDPGCPSPEALWKPTITEADRLIDALSDDSPGPSRSAAVKLGEMGEPVMGRVLEVFHSGDEDAVLGAGIALARIGRPAVPHLIAALEDDDVVAVATAANALSSIGKRDATAVVAAFDPLVMAVRRHAAAAETRPGIGHVGNEAKAAAAALGALGALGDTRALAMTIYMLDHPNRAIGQAAAEAIKAFGPKAAAPVLAAWRRGEAQTEWGVTALRLTGDPKVVDLLIEALETDAAWHAALALGEIGDERAAEPLLGVLQDKAANRLVRARAADALGKLKYAPAVPTLVAGLDDPHVSVQSASAKALGVIGDKSAVMPLIFAPQRSNPATIANAARSLGQLGDRRASGALVALVGHGEQRVRSAATTALGALGDPRAIKPLIGIMVEGSSSESSYAGQALTKIGASAAPALVQALSVEDSRKRSQVESALRKMGEEALDALIAGLEAPDCPARKELIGLLQSLAREHPRAQEAIDKAEARAENDNGRAG